MEGRRVNLAVLAELIADAYFARFPEDLERYGEAGRLWELHDTQHVLNWTMGDAAEYIDLEDQVRWLAQVLAARDFPVEHLAVNLELAADVVAQHVHGGAFAARRLRDAAEVVRAG